MNASMNNNRLELILDGLGELDAKVQNELYTYLDNSSSSSGSSSNSTSTGTGNSGIKRLLSRRKCQPPLRKPSPDSFLLEDFRTRLSEIEHWGFQVQMADASEQVEIDARQAAKGAFIAKDRERDSYIERLTGRTYDVDIQWIIAGAEEFIADFDSPREIHGKNVDGPEVGR